MRATSLSNLPITQWIAGTRACDEQSEQALWNHYFPRVVRLARARLFALQRSIYDEEDAAASAMHSLFRGIQSDRFPQLHDRQNLWRILIVITNRKLRAQWRREIAGRRLQEPAEQGDAQIGIEEIIGNEPTPDFVAEMMDETEALLEKLGDETLRRVTLMRMDGMTNDEIAAQLGRTTRTVERKMERIRLIWGECHDQ